MKWEVRQALVACQEVLLIPKTITILQYLKKPLGMHSIILAIVLFNEY